MIRISALTFMLILTTAAGVRADRVILTNGKVIEGDIVTQTSGEVQIKCQAGNTITYTKTIPTAQIRRIEKTVGQSIRRPVPAKRTTRSSAVAEPKLETLLNDAVEAWRDRDYRVASASATRLIRGASLKELDDLNTDALAKLDMEIAQLAASSRLAAALEGNTGTNINLKNVTDYESQTLVAMLDQAIEEALEFDPVEHEDDGGFLAYLLEQIRNVEWAQHATANEPQNQDDDGEDPQDVAEADAEVDRDAPLKGPTNPDASNQYVISALLSNPAAYRADPDDARRMLRHVRTTASLIHQKAKYDWTMRKDVDAKKRTARLRLALGELGKHVQAATTGRRNRSTRRGRGGSDRIFDRNTNPLRDKAQQAGQQRDVQKRDVQKVDRQERDKPAGRFNPARSSKSRTGRRN